MKQSKFKLFDKVLLKKGMPCEWKNGLLITGVGIYPSGVLQRVDPDHDPICLFLSAQESDGKWKQVYSFVHENEVEKIS